MNNSISAITMAHKLEETDMGADNWEDYDSQIKYDQDNFMRSVVTDRNLEIPFNELDIPTHSATKNGGVLNIRYNGKRGTTDYIPSHPDMMIGQDPYAGEDSGLKLANLKKHTAKITESNKPRFGYNNADTIPEQPWANPDISYAKKDLMVWSGSIMNIWQWPQFLNFQIKQPTQVDTKREAKKRIDCAKRATCEEIYADQPQDAKGLVRKPRVGYLYDMTKYQAQTIDFQETKESQRRQAKHPDRFEVLRNEVKDGHNIIDHTTRTKYFKNKLLDTIKTIVGQQEHSTKLGNSKEGRKVGSEKVFEGKSIINNITETQKKNKEVMNMIRTGTYQTDDAGYLNRQSESVVKFQNHVKSQMIKGIKKESDTGRLQRDIAQSMKLAKEEKSKLCANGLYDDVDKQKLIYQTEHQHRTGCSIKAKSYSGVKEYEPESKKDKMTPTQMFLDDHYTHVKSTKLLEENPKSIKDYSDVTDETFENNISDTCKINGRNRW